MLLATLQSWVRLTDFGDQAGPRMWGLADVAVIGTFHPNGWIDVSRLKGGSTLLIFDVAELLQLRAYRRAQRSRSAPVSASIRRSRMRRRQRIQP
ncbi:MAG: hypothetical protein R3F49_14105 [Planctomycetota bacterium]